jgi:PiT family inorganic phosphate transporter
MALAWLVTLPAAGVVGAIAAEVSSSGSIGTVLVGVAGVIVALVIYLWSRRNPVTAATVNQPSPAEPVAASA